MNIYIVTCNYDYEGSDNAGAYVDPKLAHSRMVEILTSGEYCNSVSIEVMNGAEDVSCETFYHLLDSDIHPNDDEIYNWENCTV